VDGPPSGRVSHFCRGWRSAQKAPARLGIFFPLDPGDVIERCKIFPELEPFERLPAEVKRAYFAGKLCLLPFPGSLLFWGVPGYLTLQREFTMAARSPCYILWNAMSLLMVFACLIRLDPYPATYHPLPHEDFGPIRNTFRRTHRWERVHRYEEELAIPGRQDHIAHVLFSTAPDDLELYGKPMARNSQIWSQDQHLLLKMARMPQGRKWMLPSSPSIQGGLFGYRFQYPPMCLGSSQLYWHRPLIATLSPIGRSQ